MTAKAAFNLACGSYDHTLALELGDVKVPGVDLNFIRVDHPREIFDRMIGGQEFDGCEMSASEYICRYAAGKRDLVAIPVFTSRTFRHSFITVDTDVIKKPSDLNGKRIGVQLYTMTAAVWIRGLLEDEGVDLTTIAWIEGALEQPGTHSRLTVKPLLKPINLRPNKSDRSLSQLLIDGEIDAIIGAEQPSCLRKHAHIDRLFPHFRAAETEYYRRTGVFPIMHLIAIKRSVCEQHPFIPTSLFNAATESKNMALRRMRYVGAPHSMLPFVEADIEELDSVFGGDAWPYGVEENRKTLEALVRHLHNQGMIDNILPLEELFVHVFERSQGKN